MTINSNSITELSNADLIDATMRVAADVRQSTADLIALLAEVDARRLYLPEGCASLFAYCTDVLHFSEHEAFHRIEVARAARRCVSENRRRSRRPHLPRSLARSPRRCRPIATCCGSRLVPRHMPSCDRRRICCVTRSTVVTCPP